MSTPIGGANAHAQRAAAGVREEKASGIENGVQGTPRFFINGRMHQGSYDYGILLRALEREIGAGAR